MSRRKIKRLYAEACEAYKDGLREGLASGSRHRFFDDEGMGRSLASEHARSAGFKAGAAWDPNAHKYLSGPRTDLPARVWSLVLAEAMRP